MAQKTEHAQQSRLIGERVHALAIVSLTRRSDISIRELTEDIGLDLIATMHPKGKSGLRQFGVELRGVWSKVTAEHANAVLGPSMQTMLRYGPFPFPVVLFFYTMEDDAGWYTWANEPMITSDGRFELRSNREASCHPLDNKAVDGIIEQVDGWYDAFFARTSKGMPKRRKLV